MNTNWLRLCSIDDIPSDGGSEFVLEGRILAVFKAQDQIHVIDGMCAHQGGPIAQGQLNDKCVTCPWHGWQYDVSNGHNLLTSKKMLDVYNYEIRENEIWVQIPAN